MSRRLPPLNALRAFEAAGRFESFTRAAEELGVSHSSVSRHVRGLEDRLGVKLFNDASRGVALTNDGALYLSRVAPAFDLIAEATEDISGQTETTISVSCEPILATRWLVHHLSSFQRSNPEIEVRLDANDALVDVTHYEADIAIRYIWRTTTDPSAILLSDRPVYPFASPTLIPEPVEDAAELLSHPILRDRGGEIVRDWFHAAGVSDRELPGASWRMRANLALETAIAGQGVILTSSDIVERIVQDGRLIRVHDVGYTQGAYYLLFGEGALRRKSVQRFRDWLLETSRHFRNADPDPTQ